MQEEASAGTQDPLVRIDSIIRELIRLRGEIAASLPPQSETRTVDALYGILGHGSWEEYDLDLEWERFAR